MLKSSLFFLLFFLCVPLLWAQKRAFTIEDIYRVKYMSCPQVSPDGRALLYTVSSSYLHETKRETHIYWMDRDGKNGRQFTFSAKSEFQPIWSPDGQKIAFLSNRENGNQIWTMPVNGGEATCLTAWSGGISNLVWSPDGKYIAFTTEVFPECGADDKANQKLSQSIAKGPVRAYMSDGLLYRHWNSWRNGKRNHIFTVEVSTGKLNDLTPGEYDAPAIQLRGATSYAFSPDGKELCYVSNHDYNPAFSTNNDLWVVKVSGGNAENITASNPAYDGGPKYSPNGSYIAYRVQKMPGYEADLFRLALYDRKTGKSKVLTETFDYNVNHFHWSPNSRYVYFTASVMGYTPLYRLEIETQKVTPVLEKRNIDDFTLSPLGDFLVFVQRSMDKPQEIYKADMEGGNVTPLTFENKSLCEEVDIRPAEQFWVQAEDGSNLHVFLVKPHGFDPGKKYPLILNVHGGPQSQWADAFRADFQLYPGSGYVVAFTNPRGSTGYGQTFTAQISKDWGGKVFSDLMKVTDALEKLPFVDKDRMGAMGWSYGGYMMAWFQGNTDRFKAIVCMMGVYDLSSMYGATEEMWFPEWDFGGAPWEARALYHKWSPSSYVKNFKTPCLVITGMLDFRVPYTQSLQFFTALQKQRVPSRLIVFENDGHWPDSLRSMPLYYNAHLEWFHKYLGGKPAPWDSRKLIRNQVFGK